MIDIHSHILPCLDDGPRTVDDALEMCSVAARDGVTTIVATPHILCDVGDPDIGRIRDVCESLKESLKSGGTRIELRWAAEVRMAEDLPQRIKAKEIPLLDAAGRYILLEPPLVGGNPEHLCRAIFDLRLENMTPIVAHPERCEMFAASSSLAQRVVDQGALLQINAAGIIAEAENRGASPVGDWLRNGLVHVVASDAHDTVHRPPVLSDAVVVCTELVGADQAERLFQTNPARILAGEEIEPLEYVSNRADPPNRKNNVIMNIFRRRT